MIIIALIPPLPHLPIITCKPYYQPYLLSEHKMPPRFGTPEQTKKGPTPELLEEPGNPLKAKKDLHQIPAKNLHQIPPKNLHQIPPKKIYLQVNPILRLWSIDLLNSLSSLTAI